MIQKYQHLQQNSEDITAAEKSDPNTLGLQLKVVEFCAKTAVDYNCPSQMAVPALELEIQIVADAEMGVHIVLRISNDAR